MRWDNFYAKEKERRELREKVKDLRVFDRLTDNTVWPLRSIGADMKFRDNLMRVMKYPKVYGPETLAPGYREALGNWADYYNGLEDMWNIRDGLKYLRTPKGVRAHDDRSDRIYWDKIRPLI